jgi:hypothetical protein
MFVLGICKQNLYQYYRKIYYILLQNPLAMPVRNDIRENCIDYFKSRSTLFLASFAQSVLPGITIP